MTDVLVDRLTRYGADLDAADIIDDADRHAEVYVLRHHVPVRPRRTRMTLTAAAVLAVVAIGAVLVSTTRDSVDPGPDAVADTDVDPSTTAVPAPVETRRERSQRFQRQIEALTFPESLMDQEFSVAMALDGGGSLTFERVAGQSCIRFERSDVVGVGSACTADPGDARAMISGTYRSQIAAPMFIVYGAMPAEAASVAVVVDGVVGPATPTHVPDDRLPIRLFIVDVDPDVGAESILILAGDGTVLVDYPMPDRMPGLGDQD